MDSRKTVAEEKNAARIRKKVKNAEFTALKRYKIDDYNLLDLDMVLNDVHCSFRPVSADYDTRKELLRNLNAMALDIYGKSEEESSPVLEAYGSFVMDMFTLQSDLDVSIYFGNGTSELPREQKVQTLKRFSQKLHSLKEQGHVRNVVAIYGARVPIVKFCDQGTAVECDLSVENKDGILNSQIIRIISQIDGRFQKLCMLVKYWAKAHEVNSVLNQTLNSVSLTLLVALHLQTQNPPILPPFSMLFKDGIDPPNVEKRTQKFLNWGKRNQESLGRLFATFFIKLQSIEFLWRQGLCASVLNGLWIYKKWSKATIRVEDFIDVSQNVARGAKAQGAKKIYSSINRTVDDILEFLNGKVSGEHLTQSLFVQQAVVEPSPPVSPLNGKISGTYFKNSLFGQQTVVEPIPTVSPLNGTIAGTHIKHRLFRQQAVVVPPPAVPPLNGNIAGTHLRHSLFGQQAVVEPPTVPPLIVYPQQPHNNYRNGFNGPHQEHHNKRVYLGNGYRAVEGTVHRREEERYEDLRGKRNRYVGNSNGLEEYREIPQFGIHNSPFDDPYRQVPFNGGANCHLVQHRHDGRFNGEEPMPVGLWQDYGPSFDLPLPPPPYDRVLYNKFGPHSSPQPYFGRPFY